MNADGRVLSPGPVAANDGGRTDQFVVGALAAELDQETGPQDEHLAVVGRLWLEASRFQFHFCIASTGFKKKEKRKHQELEIIIQHESF